VEFYSKNKFEKLLTLVGFYHKKVQEHKKYTINKNKMKTHRKSNNKESN